MPAANPLIFALDVPTLAEAETLVTALAPYVGLFKVGLELFSVAGPEGVRALADAGAQRVFLDLKLCDIPATVERAARALGDLPVAMLTAHCSGGIPMLEGAVRGAAGRLAVLGVTRLTSLVARPREVVAAARDAAKAGCAGVVCSGVEVGAVREALGPEALIVCPGVRPDGSASDDQRRVVTPGEAIAHGADYVVVGRPIRDAADPAVAAREILAGL